VPNIRMRDWIAHNLYLTISFSDISSNSQRLLEANSVTPKASIQQLCEFVSRLSLISASGSYLDAEEENGHTWK
jgi:hypothetical protein